jgi:diguanylate cyclase (GGDEF)-like protein/putative nucleotidyltransferase with HDIG domain
MESQEGYSILVIEEESEKKRFISRQLAQLNEPFKFVRVKSTHQALKVLAEKSYEIVITDHKPPGIDSLKLLESLKKGKTFTPTIVVTQDSDDRLARNVLKKGAFDYLTEAESQSVVLPHLFSAALERKRLEDEVHQASDRLRELAICDGLTSLYNHRHLCELMEQEFQRSRRYRHPLSFIMMDIDYFKAINDSYGHRVGDHVLTQVADLLSQSVRGVDFVARYGGDEFAVVLPETSAEAAMGIAERIHATVQSHKVSHEGHSLYVSTSIGVASLHQQMVSKDELITLADKALYEAKNRGRGQICSSFHLSPQEQQLKENLQPIQELSQKIGTITLEVKRTYLDIVIECIQKQHNFVGYLKEHGERVCHWASTLAESQGLAPAEVEAIRVAALLHDIGKVAIDEELLCKREAMTSLELGLIRKHPIIGAKMLQDIPFLDKEISLVLHHHERFDGLGYPFKLCGDEIPKGARIIALAEAWDAMTGPQPYRDPLPRQQALDEIEKSANTQFDPDLVPPFLEIVSR